MILVMHILLLKELLLLQEQIIGVEKIGLQHLKIAPFIRYISKINDMPTDNAEEFHVAMPMHNLIEYSKNYRKTTGSLWNYQRDELTDDRNDTNFPNKNVINSESFKYKRSVTGSTYNVDAKITNAEGNEINNPAYDANKSGKKRS